MKLTFLLLGFLFAASRIAYGQQLNTAEYFFDTDPGAGKGRAIALGGTETDTTVNFDLTGIPPGLHQLYIRLKNSDGNWGLSYAYSILVNSGTGNGSGPAVLTSAEWYLDKDPGFGKGVPIALSGTMLDSSLNFDLTGVTPGLHSLYIRLENSDGNWSLIYQHTLLVNKGTGNGGGNPDFTGGEYYFDTDPGPGNGKPLSVNSQSVDSIFNIDLTGVSTGLHNVAIRLQNTDGSWSLAYQYPIQVTNGTAGTPMLTHAEYFFDTDPGTGKGKEISIQGASIDTSLNFDITGLQPGVHMLYVRLENSLNVWSLSAGQNVFVPANAGRITGLSYFLDTVSNRISIPVKDSSVVDTTISIQVPDDGANSRMLGLQLTGPYGLTGNAVLDTVSLCSLYKPEGGFRYGQYASTFTLIDTSHYNPSRRVRWFANNTLFDSGYSINYRYPAGFTGSVNLLEATGTGCRIDSVTRVLNMPGIEDYEPKIGSYNSDFTLTLYGGGLDSTLNIYLRDSLGPNSIINLYPYLKYSPDGVTLIAVFDLHAYPISPNSFDLQFDTATLFVQYPNGYQYVGPQPVALLKSFDPYACSIVSMGNINAETVAAGGLLQYYRERCPVEILQTFRDTAEPYIATNITGNTDIRTGVWSTLNFTITNTGAVVGKEIPFYIVLPAYYDVDTTNWHIVGPYTTYADSVALIIPVIDTTINGRLIQYNMIGLMQPILGPGQSVTIPIRIRTTQIGSDPLFYWASQRFFGSPANLFLDPCAALAVDQVLGYIPIVGQMSAAWDWGWSVGSAATNYEFHVLYGDAWNPNADVGSITLNTVGALGSGAVAEGLNLTKDGIINVIKKLAGSKTDFIAGSIGNGVLSTATGAANNALSSSPCIPLNQALGFNNKQLKPKTSHDPNYLSGNSDYDTLRNFINNYTPQYYSVTFENSPAATANAQHVYITDTLNPAKFNLATFRLSRFTIGDSSYTIPAYRFTATKDVPLASRPDMKVRFTATFDTATGILQADYFSIDTSGHVLPLDSLDGFLPPDADGVSGTGGLSYSVYAYNINTLDTFSNKAYIYFDNNAPIVTNTWINTVDTTGPVTKIVKALYVNDTTVKFVIQNSDLGSGVKYSILYDKSPGDSAFNTLGIVYGDTATVQGSKGATFSFFTMGTDNVNNTELKDSAVEINYTFGQGALPLTLLDFTGQLLGNRVRLDWTTANEMNTLRFDVEKSPDGMHFFPIGSVPAKGNTGQENHYALYDIDPVEGNNFYRLKETDLDGNITYSSIVRIYYDQNGYVIISPNPAHDFVTIKSGVPATVIQLLDASGRIIRTYTKAATDLYSLANISQGLYYIRMIGPNSTGIYKLVIQ